MNELAAEVILFPSVCFTLTQLHKSSLVHNTGSGGLLKDVISKLLDSDILIICPRGIQHANKTTPVYIKRLPVEDDAETESDLASVLSEYEHKNKPISMELYKQKCQSLSLVTGGSVHNDVYEILQRPEYATRDFFALFTMPNAGLIEAQCLTHNNNGK